MRLGRLLDNPVLAIAASLLFGPGSTDSSLAARPVAARQRWQEIAAYVATVSVCLLVLTWSMKLQYADLHIPFTYQGDALFYHLVVKGLVDHGWYLGNGALGMPYGLDLRDVPTSDNNLYFLPIKLISLFTSNYAVIINLFFLLSFPLTTVIAFYVLRRFGLSHFPAAVGSLLYTFLPFHLVRGQHHLFLTSYYLVPLMVMLILWVCSEEITLTDAQSGWPRLNLRQPKLIASLVICLLAASAGYHYAFFTCFFLLVAATALALRSRHVRALLLPGLLIAVICVGVVANLLPSLVYTYRHGAPAIVKRSPTDADIYGLKIAQLVMPATKHRLPWLSWLKDEYNLRPLVNENDDATLGIVGTGGFLFLLWWLFFRKPEIGRMKAAGSDGLLNHLSLLNAAAVLLATVGGLGSIFAFFISPQIRAYNRVIVFIGFFAFFCVALLLERGASRYSTTAWRRMIFCGAATLLLGVGLFDQRSHRVIPDYARLKTDFRHDAEFVQRIQAALPAGAMVFQLPVVSFPESPKINRLNDYDLVKGYLHSTRLRWSYGAIKGRESDAWQVWAAAKPAPDFAATLALAGFNGIYVDRFGYADSGAQLEADLEGVIGKPMVSENGRLAFFDLTEHQRRLREETPAGEWEARRESALSPLLPVWQNGCSYVEGSAENTWRWCSSEVQLNLVNHSHQVKRVTLEMSFAAGAAARLHIKSPFFTEQLDIGQTGTTPFSRTITVPPGWHAIKFDCDARPVLTPNDFRDLVFRVHNFKLREI